MCRFEASAPAIAGQVGWLTCAAPLAAARSIARWQAPIPTIMTNKVKDRVLADGDQCREAAHETVNVPSNTTTYTQGLVYEAAGTEGS